MFNSHSHSQNRVCETFCGIPLLKKFRQSTHLRKIFPMMHNSLPVVPLFLTKSITFEKRLHVGGKSPGFTDYLCRGCQRRSTEANYLEPQCLAYFEPSLLIVGRDITLCSCRRWYFAGSSSISIGSASLPSRTLGSGCDGT